MLTQDSQNALVGQLRITSAGPAKTTSVATWSGTEWITLRYVTEIVMSLEADGQWQAELTFVGVKVALDPSLLSPV
jgi:hypothetical protein